MGAYLCTLIFVTVPSMASVYNEYALKSQYDTSIYLQNLFLYGYGAIFNFLGILGTVIVKVSLGRYHSKNLFTSQHGNGAFHTEEETLEQILNKENSAASVFSWLKANAQTSNLALTKDVVGVVATLAKVESDDLSRKIERLGKIVNAPGYEEKVSKNI